MSSEDLLKLLEAHGQQFMQSFDSAISIGKRKADTTKSSPRASKKNRIENDSEEEWAGIGPSSPSGSGSNPSTGEDSSSGSEEDEEAYTEDEDDDFTYDGHAPQPDVVVFSEAGRASAVQRGSRSGFMSSKVSKLTQDTATASRKKKSASDDGDDDLTNAQNDALLHRLVHTQLLSGSLNPDLDLTPAQRKKALAGRVLEAAGKAKLGKGEATVRHAERNRAAKHVRDGLHEKQKERQKKELEEAKQLGNYHPTLKSLYDSSLDSKPNKRRDRGMKMGVGSFKGGILRLSKNEIGAAEGRTPGASRGRGSHRRGGKR